MKLLVILLITMAFLAPSDWVTLQLKEFKVEFPGLPIYSTHIQPSEIGDQRTDSYTYKVSNVDEEDDLVYSLIFTEYPQDHMDTLKGSDREALIREAIDAMINKNGRTLISESDITLNGFSGKEIRVEIEGVGINRMRLYLVEKRMYVLLTITKDAQPMNGSSDRFMNSFAVTP